MLYIFYGNDVTEVRKRALTHARTEARGVELVSLPPESFSRGALEDLAGAQSLFGGREVVVVDTPSESEYGIQTLIEHAAILDESANVFVVIERSLTAPEKKTLGSHAKEIIELKRTADDRFNTFALADALASRDRRTLWLQLTEARQRGSSNEEIIGILMWQLKVMRLAACTTTPEEAGQKPFVYNKAKRALAKFKEGELETCSRELIMLYHDGHSGKRDLTLGLESWVLTI